MKATLENMVRFDSTGTYLAKGKKMVRKMTWRFDVTSDQEAGQEVELPRPKPNNEPPAASQKQGFGFRGTDLSKPQS